jgi:hypothetical protein
MRREDYLWKNRELGKDKAALEAELHGLQRAAQVIEEKSKAEEHARRIAEVQKSIKSTAKQMKSHHDDFVGKLEIDKVSRKRLYVELAKAIIDVINGQAHPEQLRKPVETEIHLSEEQFEKKRNIEKQKAMQKAIQESNDDAGHIADAQAIEKKAAEERAERAKEAARKMEEFRRHMESKRRKRDGYER